MSSEHRPPSPLPGFGEPRIAALERHLRRAQRRVRWLGSGVLAATPSGPAALLLFRPDGTLSWRAPQIGFELA